jgi:hypothetical protein
MRFRRNPQHGGFAAHELAPCGDGAVGKWVGFSNRGSPVNSILSVVTAGTMVLFVIGA